MQYYKKYFAPVFLGILLCSLLFISPAEAIGTASPTVTAEGVKVKAVIDPAEIRARIAALQAQIKALQELLAESEQPAAWCYDFARKLKFGNNGEDVRALQTALTKEGFYQRAVNGDFDEYTASAVVGFQQKYAQEILAPWGLKYGTGFVGDTTIAKLNQIYGCGVTPPKPECIKEGKKGSMFNNDACCSGLTKIGNSFPAEGGCIAPTDGSFLCTYCGNGVCGPGENTCNCPKDCPGEVKITISITSPRQGEVITGPIRIEATAKSTSKLGVMGLTIEQGVTGMHTWFNVCEEPIEEEPAASGGPRSYEKTCWYSWNPGNYEGRATLTADISDAAGGEVSNSIVVTCKPEQKCIEEGEKGNSTDGDVCCGGLAAISDSYGDGVTCSIAVDPGAFVCSYCGNGICGLGENACNCPEDCKEEDNLPPVIDGVTAPTQLKVKEQGTWKIEAHDPENGTLSYSVNWGDEYVPVTEEMRVPFGKLSQTTTFTHSYSKAGTYTVRFTITDDHRQTARTSSTVKVVEEGASCADSDNGKDYYTKGSLKSELFPGKTFEDYCFGSVATAGANLGEYYCRAGGHFSLASYRCPYGCENGACRGAEEKSITVISPNGGETLYEGEYFTIQWKSAGLAEDEKIFLLLFDFKGANASIARDIPSSQNSYRWKVTTGLSWGFGHLDNDSRVYASLISDEASVNSDQYKIFIGTDGPQDIWDKSDNYFSIAGAADEVIIDTGTIGYSPVEGGCYYITGSSGKKYEPINLEDEFKVNGLKVKFSGRGLEDVDTICMIGTPLELTSIQRIDTFTCTDTDGGENYYVKGQAQSSDSSIEGRTDCCKAEFSTYMGDSAAHIGPGGGPCVGEGLYLYEAVCKDNIPTSVAYQCPNGCEDGVCVESVEEVITIKGRLIDQLTNQPVAGVAIYTDTTAGGRAVSPVYTAQNGEFEFTTAQDKVKMFPFWPDCYMQASLVLQRNYGTDDWVIASNIFDSEEKRTPVTGSVVDIGDFPLWPAVDIHTYSDIPSQFFIQYKQKSQPGYNGAGNSRYTNRHTLSNSIPLDYDVRIQFIDAAGTEYHSPLTKFGFDIGCKDATLNFTNGEYTWGVCGNGVCEEEQNTCPADCKEEKSITVTSPNGGEEWIAGQGFNITWTSQGLADSAQVGINVLKSHAPYCKSTTGTTTECLASPVATNSGVYSWTIHSDMELDDDYTIKIESMDDASVFDESDNFFTIFEAVLTPPGTPTSAPETFRSIESGLASIAEAVKALEVKIGELWGR